MLAAGRAILFEFASANCMGIGSGLDSLDEIPPGRARSTFLVAENVDEEARIWARENTDVVHGWVGRGARIAVGRGLVGAAAGGAGTTYQCTADRRERQPGFLYESRVHQLLPRSQRMLAEGVSPALIENGAHAARTGRAAGMPVGLLAASDEVSLQLQWDLICAHERELGAAYRRPPGYDVIRRMVVDLNRLGRKARAGFYEYPAGAPKHLWPVLAEQYPWAAEQPSVDDVKRRVLYARVVEAARCLD